RLRRQGGRHGRGEAGRARPAPRAGDDRHPRRCGRRARRDRRTATAHPRRTSRDQGAEVVVTTELFIRRPVLTTLFMAAIRLFGAMAYRLLPVNDLPNVDYPAIQVIANLPGASPETMASAVATPLEKQFTTIAGIDSMTSTSALGVTQINITFALDR